MAQALIHIPDVEMAQFDIREFEGCDRFLAGSDLTSREINAEKRALRQDTSHRDQICPIRTGQFEYAAVMAVRRSQPEKLRQGFQPIRVALLIRVRWIWNLIVACAVGHGHWPILIGAGRLGTPQQIHLARFRNVFEAFGPSLMLVKFCDLVPAIVKVCTLTPKSCS